MGLILVVLKGNIQVKIKREREILLGTIKEYYILPSMMTYKNHNISTMQNYTVI